MASIFDKEEWLSAVANLRAKAAEFQALREQVLESYSIAKEYPSLLNEYEALLFKSNVIESTIKSVTNGIDIIFGMFNTVFGDEDVDGLGIVPLVPVAVILSAIGAITYWINSSIKYLNKIKEIKRIENQGYTVEEAYKMVNEQNGGLMQKLMSPYVLIGGGLLIVLLLSRKR